MAKKDIWNLDELGITPQTTIAELMARPPYSTTEDKHGHEIMIGAKFPKTIARWVETILERPGTPYKLKADLARDALMLGLCIISLRHKISEEWKLNEQLALMTSRAEDARRAVEQEAQFVIEIKSMVQLGTLGKDTAKNHVIERLDKLDSILLDKTSDKNVRSRAEIAKDALIKKLVAEGIDWLLSDTAWAIKS